MNVHQYSRDPKVEESVRRYKLTRAFPANAQQSEIYDEMGKVF